MSLVGEQRLVDARVVLDHRTPLAEERHFVHQEALYGEVARADHQRPCLRIALAELHDPRGLHAPALYLNGQDILAALGDKIDLR